MKTIDDFNFEDKKTFINEKKKVVFLKKSSFSKMLAKWRIYLPIWSMVGMT